MNFLKTLLSLKIKKYISSRSNYLLSNLRQNCGLTYTQVYSFMKNFQFKIKGGIDKYANI